MLGKWNGKYSFAAQVSVLFCFFSTADLHLNFQCLLWASGHINQIMAIYNTLEMHENFINQIKA